MSQIDIGYEPAPKKKPDPTQRRSWFLDARKNPLKCKCGGLIIGLRQFEFVLPSHEVAVREGHTVGGCENAIINYTED